MLFILNPAKYKPHTRLTMYGHFLMNYFVTSGLVVVNQSTSPQRSLHITPLYLLLWGYVKDYIYRIFVDDTKTLDTRTIEGIRNVSKEMVTVWAELE